MRPNRDKLLIDTVIAELDVMALPDLKAEGDAVGVSGEAVRKWRSGETSRLNKNSRPQVTSFLRSRGRDVDKLVISRETRPSDAEGEGPEPTPNGRYDLLAEYHRINGMAIDEWRKDLKIAALEALTRAEAMAADARAREADARAADQRARAARTAALSDLSRTRFLSRVEDAAIRQAAELRAAELRRQRDEQTDRSAQGGE